MTVLSISIFLALGAAAGLLAGLLGVGGGLIIVAALAWLLPPFGVPDSAVMHVALATALATIIATSISSTRSHWKRGSVMWTTAAWLAPGLVIGGALGALVADRLATDTLRWFVAGFCALAALQLWFGRTPPDHGAKVEPRGPAFSGYGVVIGAISALVGIGGGSMTVPVLIAHGARPVHAVGTSAACGFAIAVASAAGFAVAGRDAVDLPWGSIGYVYLPAAAAMAVASVLCAPYGAALAHRLKGAHLKRVFALFLAAMSIATALSG